VAKGKHVADSVVSESGTVCGELTIRRVYGNTQSELTVPIHCRRYQWKRMTAKNEALMTKREVAEQALLLCE
jgi:hypothetical protein